MVKYVGLQTLRDLIHKVGPKDFITNVMEYIKEDFSRWGDFHKSPRHSIYVPEGVVELMPTADQDFHAFKYVNGHPPNPDNHNLMTIFGYGALSDTHTGQPKLLSEMTLLTAIRTGANSALASEYLARKDSTKLGIVGCGAQSEFQTLTHIFLMPIKELYYYDIDSKAMEKYANNIKNAAERYGFQVQLHPTSNVQEILDHKVDMLVLCTSNTSATDVVLDADLYPGLFVDAIGGDSELKYEISKRTLDQFDKIYIEYMPQTKMEGEIKRYTEEERKNRVNAELWEVITHKKEGRTNDRETILFDSVGFAIEDFSALRYIYDLVKNDSSIPDIDLVPTGMDDVKDLYSYIK